MLTADFSHFIQQLALMAIPLVLAITLHEAAHGWVADKFGDSTAKSEGRLTLNPLAHVDPFGTLLLPILLAVMSQGRFVLGYAKPVPVNFHNLRNPKRDMIWVAAAGPGINLVMAALFGILFQLILALYPQLIAEIFLQEGRSREGVVSFILVPLALICIEGVKWNVLLCLFNLIPIPPLDGGRVLVGILPRRQAETLAKIEPYGFFIILLLIFLPLGLMSHLLFPVMGLLIRLFTGMTLF